MCLVVSFELGPWGFLLSLQASLRGRVISCMGSKTIIIIFKDLQNRLKSLSETGLEVIDFTHFCSNCCKL